ncbi:hypothetical protein CLCR_03165 [Cladophialophora carrionii]|uniref:Uncharacterized protein n=1 Tax=Cladophialophora carrionii TaxID=86049 RepID=A0A1C1D2R9_9EURO|nr:hypothetical protein CLCR_03165 [Cladophialophora carrionii]
MLTFLYFALTAMIAPLVVGLPAALPNNPEAVQRADVSYTCDCIDHWFKHGLFWIRASSVTGCMSLETIPQTIYALNAIPKPDYFSNDYPNLICSLGHNECQWTYSPLDFLANTTSFPESITGGIHPRERDIPMLEKVDDPPLLLPLFVPVPKNQAPQKR